MKRLVQESQEKLAEKDFAKSLQLAEQALQVDPENARLYLLAGKGAKGCGKIEKAIEYFLKSSEWDKDLMAPLIQASTLLKSQGRHAEASDILQRQVSLALSKGNDQKATMFRFDLAHELEHCTGRVDEALDEFSRAIEGVDALDLDSLDEETRAQAKSARNSACESIVRIQMSHLFKRTPKPLIVSCAEQFFRSRVEAFQPDASVTEDRFTLSKVSLAMLAILMEDREQLVLLCEKLRPILSSATNNPGARQAWYLLSAFLLLLFSEEKNFEQAVSIALQVLEMQAAFVREEHEREHVHFLSARWRAFECLASFSATQHSASSEARQCSDLAVSLLKTSRDLFEQAAKEADDAAASKSASKGVFILGGSSKPETEEERRAKILKEKREEQKKKIRTIERLVACTSSQLWLTRCILFSRYFFAGSPGFFKDAISVTRFSKEALTSHQSIASTLPCVTIDSSDVRSCMLFALEWTSHLSLSQGNKTCDEYGEQLFLQGTIAAKDQHEHLAFGVWRSYNCLLSGFSGDAAELEVYAAVTALKEAEQGPDPLLSKHANAALAHLKASYALVKEGEEKNQLLSDAFRHISKALAHSQGVSQDAPTLEKVRSALSLPELSASPAPRATPNLPWFVTLQGFVLWAANKVPQAQATLLKAVQLDSSLALGFYVLGRIYSDTHKDVTKAARCFEKAFLLNTKDKAVLERLSGIYWTTQQLSLQESVLKRAIMETEMLSQKGTNIGKGTIFGETIRFAWDSLGRLQMFQEKFSDAALSFQKAIGADAHCPGFWQGLGDAYRKMGRYTAAMRTFEEAEALHASQTTSSNPSQHAYVLFRLGRLLSATHEREKALACLLRSNEMYPHPITAWATATVLLRLAQAHLRSGFYASVADRVLDGLQVLKATSHSSATTYQSFWDVEGALWSLLATSMPPATIQETVGLQQSVCFAKARAAYAKSIHQQPWLKSTWKNATQLGVKYVQQELSSSISLPKSSETRALHDFVSRTLRRLAETSVSVDPIDPTSWNLLGTTFVCLADLAEDRIDAEHERQLGRLAQHCFVRSLQLNSVGNSAAWTNLSQLLLATKTYNAANVSLGFASGDESTAPVVWSSRAELEQNTGGDIVKTLASLECAVDAAGDGIPAVSALQAPLQYALQLLTTSSSDSPFESNKSLRQLNSLDWSRVHQVLGRYTRRNPDDAQALVLYGVVLAGRGMKQNAEQVFREANRIVPGICDLELIQLGTSIPADTVALTSENALVIASGLVRSSTAKSMEKARQILDQHMQQSNPAWLVLRYRAGGYDADLVEQCLGTCPDPFALAALEQCDVENLNKVQERVSDATIKAKVRLALLRENVRSCQSRRTRKSLLSSHAKCAFMAPWSAEVWVGVGEGILECAAPSVLLEAEQILEPKQLSTTIHCASIGELLLQHLHPEDLGEDLICRATSLVCSAEYLRGNIQAMSRKAKHLLWNLPYSLTAKRLVASAALALGVSTNDIESVQLSRALFSKLPVSMDPEQRMLDCLGLSEALVAAGAPTSEVEHVCVQVHELAEKSRHGQSMKALATCMVARSLAGAGKKVEAVKAYQSALQQLPSSPLLWVELANVAVDVDVELAGFCLESAVECVPVETSEQESQDSPLIASSLRILHAIHVASTAGITKCLGTLNKVTKEFPEDVNAHLVRAWLCMLVGDAKNKKNAVSGFKRVLELDPSNRFANTLLSTLVEA